MTHTTIAIVSVALLVLLRCFQPGLAGAETFKLRNGDKLSGTVIQRTPHEIILDHPALGRLVVPVATLKQAKSKLGLLGTALLRGWDKEVHVSMKGKRGNSNGNNLVTGRAALQSCGQRVPLRAAALVEPDVSRAPGLSRH